MTAEDPRPSSTADDPRDLTVGRTAALVGVSVKTLHHWDHIGLARPSGRTGTGYRLYSDADVARLHRILVYRELGFPLAAIGRILDDPTVDARAHLRRQRTQLAERVDRLRHMAGAIDRLLESLDRGLLLSAEEQVAIFGDDWRPSWVEEAAERWGHSPQWTQYAERVVEKTPEDWKATTAATEALNADLAAAVRGGVAPGSPGANRLAERHRALMSTYFDCTHAMQVCIGRMFNEDPRFAGHFDGLEPGLASWLRGAIDANAEARGIDPDAATWE